MIFVPFENNSFFDDHVRNCHNIFKLFMLHLGNQYFIRECTNYACVEMLPPSTQYVSNDIIYVYAILIEQILII